MKKRDIRNTPMETLLQSYKRLAAELGAVMDKFYWEQNEQIADYTRVFKKLWAIKQEIAARGEERQLLPLLDDPNPWVQQSAAAQLLPVEEEKARAVLTRIGAKMRIAVLDVGFYARQSLGSWDDGGYTGVKPNREPDQDPKS